MSSMLSFLTCKCNSSSAVLIQLRERIRGSLLTHELCSIEKYILQYLGAGYDASKVECYIDCNFTSQGMFLLSLHFSIFLHDIFVFLY